MSVSELAPSEYTELRAEYRAFMDEHVYPNEAALTREDDAADTLVRDLRARAKESGLWAPHLPPEAGGTGRGFLAYAHLNEEIGRVTWAQLIFNCQAPDAGNGEILHEFRSALKIEVFRPRRALTACLDEVCPERRHEPSQVGAPLLEMRENSYAVRIEVAGAAAGWATGADVLWTLDDEGLGFRQ